MDLINEIRLNDLKERGASFIREKEIEKDVCIGTLYYYYDKYDQDLSSAEVTVRYFPRGGAVITGPHPESSKGYEKLTEYLNKLSCEEYIKERIRKRKALSAAFTALKVLMAILMIRSLITGVMTGDLEIWEKLIIESVIFIAIEMISQRSLRL